MRSLFAPKHALLCSCHPDSPLCVVSILRHQWRLQGFLAVANKVSNITGHNMAPTQVTHCNRYEIAARGIQLCATVPPFRHSIYLLPISLSSARSIATSGI